MNKQIKISPESYPKNSYDISYYYVPNMVHYTNIPNDPLMRYICSHNNIAFYYLDVNEKMWRLWGFHGPFYKIPKRNISEKEE
jgi:hypothetical protein